MKICTSCYITNTLVVVTIFFSSCTNRTEENNNHDYVTEIAVTPSDELFNWDDAVESVTTFPLQTNEASVFQNIHKLVVFDNKYFILDVFSSRLLCFAQDGSFSGSAGRRGKGPKEYSEMRDVAFTNDGMYTLDYKRLHFYERENILEISKTVDLKPIKEFNPSSFCMSEKLIHLWSSNPDSYNPGSDNYRLYSLSDNEVVKKAFQYDHKIGDGPRFYFNSTDSSYFIKPVDGDNTVYSIKGDSIQARYRFNFTEKALPNNYFDQSKTIDLNDYLKSDYFKGYKNIWRVGHLIYFTTYGPGGFTYEGLFDTRSNKVIKFGKRDWPFNPTIVYSDGRSLYGYYQKHFLANYEGQTTTNKVYLSCKSELDRLSVDDNPLLAKIDLKEISDKAN